MSRGDSSGSSSTNNYEHSVHMCFAGPTPRYARQSARRLAAHTRHTFWYSRFVCEMFRLQTTRTRVERMRVRTSGTCRRSARNFGIEYRYDTQITYLAAPARHVTERGACGHAGPPRVRSTEGKNACNSGQWAVHSFSGRKGGWLRCTEHGKNKYRHFSESRGHHKVFFLAFFNRVVRFLEYEYPS